MTTLTTLLALPFAKQVLAFEELHIRDFSAEYKGVYPYAATKSGEGYVRWATDSMERLLAMPHEDALDDALMHLAIHVGEAPDTLNALEIRDDLRRLCARLRLMPPTGAEAVKLGILGLLEDMVHGVIPTERTWPLLTKLHHLLWCRDVSCGAAFDRFSAFYWELDEIDDLSRLGLAEGLRSWRDVLQNFRNDAECLLTAIRLEFVQEGEWWRLAVRVPEAPPGN